MGLEARRSLLMSITGSMVASTRSKFSSRQLLSSPVPPSIAMLETSVSRTSSKTLSLRKRFTSLSVRGHLAPIGGVTSSGGWITCESIRFRGLLTNQDVGR